MTSSSSSVLESNVQDTHQQVEDQQERFAYELKGVTMGVKEWKLKI